MKLLLQHKIVAGYLLLMAVIGCVWSPLSYMNATV